MANLQQALVEFGSDIGLPLEGLPASGEVQFRLGDGMLLGVAASTTSGGDDEVVVHWAEPLRYDIAQLVVEAMKHAAELRDANHPVQVGLRTTTAGDWLVLGTRFPAHEASARRIHQAADFLKNWRQSLEVRV